MQSEVASPESGLLSPALAETRRLFLHAAEQVHQRLLGGHCDDADLETSGQTRQCATQQMAAVYLLRRALWSLRQDSYLRLLRCGLVCWREQACPAVGTPQGWEGTQDILLKSLLNQVNNLPNL
eukprot:TRINITY_DN11665_c0_g1_i1.p1 TRINITY_DN11665_c0_g1~~TRINITY_DN11665_c0_g1_i1.p1  ORF type:complete len:124 (+),score=15.18 TRINITY_DN11665_c0_g1_i1:176-547(+)